MKTLSVRQPWAWLIVNGYKNIENRSRRTKHRGPVYIHASKTVEKKALERLKEERPDIPFPETFETGGIVGRAEITDCVDESSSSWFEGPHGYVMEQAAPLSFFPVKGRLGLFTPKEDLPVKRWDREVRQASAFPEPPPPMTKKKVDPRTILKGGEFLGVKDHYFQVVKVTKKKVVIEPVAVRDGVRPK